MYNNFLDMNEKREQKILITGHLGFIGFHVAKCLLENGHSIMGIDSLNTYYSKRLKLARGKILKELSMKYISKIKDLSDADTLKDIAKFKPDIIINLAAQAGVRHSLRKPEDYISNNINSFLNIITYARDNPVEKIIYASTSSVYGGNKDFPFSEKDNTDNPLQFYAVTKKTNELMAHAYNDLYSINFIGLRFFTVYGPWGRPDMSLFKFTKSILEGKPIELFNNGLHTRDFTYIDDLQKAIMSVALKKNKYLKNNYSEIYNIGGNNPITLKKYVRIIEKSLGKEAKKNYLPLQKGDVKKTISDVSKIKKHYGFKPEVKIEDGIRNFIDWYKNFYKI